MRMLKLITSSSMPLFSIRFTSSSGSSARHAFRSASDLICHEARKHVLF